MESQKMVVRTTMFLSYFREKNNEWGKILALAEGERGGGDKVLLKVDIGK